MAEEERPKRRYARSPDLRVVGDQVYLSFHQISQEYGKNENQLRYLMAKFPEELVAYNFPDTPKVYFQRAQLDRVLGTILPVPIPQDPKKPHRAD